MPVTINFWLQNKKKFSVYTEEILILCVGGGEDAPRYLMIFTNSAVLQACVIVYLLHSVTGPYYIENKWCELFRR